MDLMPINVFQQLPEWAQGYYIALVIQHDLVCKQCIEYLEDDEQREASEMRERLEITVFRRDN